jgi:RNA-directed DNA polymerase
MARRGMRQPTRSKRQRGQLAFAWGEAGEAQPGPSKGPTPTAAPERAGALTHLMEQVVAAENMRRALKRVRANKGSPGVDGMTVQQLPEHLMTAWSGIRQTLLEGTYQPQPVKRVEIPKPDGGKRQLGIPTVVDRLIQQAILQILEPHYDPGFSPHSYGFRPGKSAHQALSRAQVHVASGKHWVVDLDLEKFFDRVNHDVLMGRLARKIGDRRVLRLIRRYLEAGILLNGVVVEREEGTPQGGPLSPLLSNILLDELDKELEKRGHSFCRYADDCNIYVQSRRAGERVMASVIRFLETRLRLRVNRAKSAVARPTERKFLGFRILGTEKARLSIHPKSLKRAKDTIRRITKRNRGVSLARVLEQLRTFTNGWVGYFWVAHTPSVFQELDAWTRRRLRCYQWKLWKKPRHRLRQLQKAGIGPWLAAGVAYDGPGYWRVAGCPAMSRALPNAKLAELGFHSLHERYDALVTTARQRLDLA